MPYYALSAIGRDRPGIVAALTGVLLNHGVNVEDSQATILRGHFSIVLILAARDGTDRERLFQELARTGEELELEAVVLRDVAEMADAGPEPSHVVTVFGVDDRGILHGAARVLAEHGVDVTDMNTRLLEEEGEEPLYALMMEVYLPDGASAEELEDALGDVGESQGLEVSVRELEQEEL